MRRLRKYVFALTFLRGKEALFLLLHRTKNWKGWEFPKGGLKTGEGELTGLAREIFEETGTRKFRIAAKTNRIIRYEFPRGFLKDGKIYHGARGRLYVVELFSKKVKIDRREHDRYVWASKDDALKLLTHRNQRNALRLVVEEII